MIDALLILILPFLLAFVALLVFKGKITLGEFALQIAAPVLVAAIMISCFAYSEMSDTETWNSQVTSRASEHVSCSHSYSCNCRMVTSGSGKNQTTSMICDTCYEHAFDVDWIVRTSSGEELDIDRVDRQGLIMPPRWAKVYVGEPFSSEHRYANYLLLNKGSVLLGGQGDVKKFAALIPQRPRVYDYYRVDHVLVTGGVPLDTNPWNWLLNEANKKLGPAKQVNILLVVAKTDDPAYVQALKSSWLGGKKNEVIVVLGSLDGHKIEFADVLSWSPRQDLKVELRDQIQEIGSLDQRDAIVAAITTQVNTRFERMHMEKYHYLLASAELGNGQMIATFIVCLLLELGISYWAIVNDSNLDTRFN